MEKKKYKVPAVFPAELEKFIKAAAKADGRSINGWIVMVVRKALAKANGIA